MNQTDKISLNVGHKVTKPGSVWIHRLFILFLLKYSSIVSLTRLYRYPVFLSNIQVPLKSMQWPLLMLCSVTGVLWTSSWQPVQSVLQTIFHTHIEIDIHPGPKF